MRALSTEESAEIVDNERVDLLVQVDNILVAARGKERMAKVKAHLACATSNGDVISRDGVGT